MSQADTTKESAPPDEPEMVRSIVADMKVPPMIQQALDRHRRDLPELMKTHPRRWAAYHGEHRLEFGRSKRKLYYKYLDRGLSLDELIVLGVEPMIPDEI